MGFKLSCMGATTADTVVGGAGAAGAGTGTAAPTDGKPAGAHAGQSKRSQRAWAREAGSAASASEVN